MTEYLALSRRPAYSLSFALPLLVLYELLAAWAHDPGEIEVRNGADALLRGLFALGGARSGSGLLLLLIGGAAALAWRDWRRAPLVLRRQYYGLMLAESAVLGLVFGSIVSRLTAVLLSPLAWVCALGLQGWPPSTAATCILSPAAASVPWAQLAATLPAAGGATRASLAAEALGHGQMLVLALGAGLYEELVFRVLLVGGLMAVGSRLAPGRRWAAGAVAVTTSALLFAAFHYVGALGDSWSLASFAFRFLGGLGFSLIYALRGFGIVAWTHALYDVFLLTLL